MKRIAKYMLYGIVVALAVLSAVLIVYVHALRTSASALFLEDECKPFETTTVRQEPYGMVCVLPTSI